MYHAWLLLDDFLFHQQADSIPNEKIAPGNPHCSAKAQRETSQELCNVEFFPCLAYTR